MNWDQAHRIAQQLASDLAPYCGQVEIAGSVRRAKPEVKDIEIVYRPVIGLRPVDLFTAEPYPLVDDALARLLATGTLRPDDQVKRWGPKYKRCVHLETGIVVELFAADAENWGYILALRTGPADFNKILVSKAWQGGALPLEVSVADGYVYHRGRRCTLTTEDAFFTLLGLPCWPPAGRTPERLSLYLDARRRGTISREMPQEGELHAPRA